MRRKFVKRAVCGALAAVSLFCFAACDLGNEVINAYDIAVKNGFTGTEEEWLQSLKGGNGKDGQGLDMEAIYDAAVKNGYEKDFLTFLKEYFADVDLSVQENNDTATIAKNISSVVSICCAFRTTKTVSQGWFGTQEVTTPSAAEGSGVIIELNREAGNALILTNYHVLYSKGSDGERGISECIYVYPYGAREYFSSGVTDVNKDGTLDEKDQGDFDGDGVKATFVGGAMDYDIAILKVEGSSYFQNPSLNAATIGDSNEVLAGEKTFAIGNSNGEGISVTSGVLSVDSEYIAMSALDGRDLNGDGAADGVSFRVMRTDAAINHGNSGGALFNAKGELIGITNAKNVEDETDNMGYALPITQVKYLVDNILYNGGVAKRATLGVMTVITASSSTLVENPIDGSDNGRLQIVEEVSVAEVDTGVAASGKLKVGDVIESITVGGKTVEATRRFYINDILLTVRKGDKVTLSVLREGQKKTVEITFDKDEYFTTFA